MNPEEKTWKELLNHYGKRSFPLLVVGATGYLYAGKRGAMFEVLGYVTTSLL